MHKGIQSIWTAEQDEILIKAINDGMEQGLTQKKVILALMKAFDREYGSIRTRITRLREEKTLVNYVRRKSRKSGSVPGAYQNWVDTRKKPFVKPSLNRPDWFDKENLQERILAGR